MELHKRQVLRQDLRQKVLKRRLLDHQFSEVVNLSQRRDLLKEILEAVQVQEDHTTVDQAEVHLQEDHTIVDQVEVHLQEGHTIVDQAEVHLQEDHTTVDQAEVHLQEDHTIVDQVEVHLQEDHTTVDQVEALQQEVHLQEVVLQEALVAHLEVRQEVLQEEEADNN